MTATRSTYVFSIAAFLLGFDLGGLLLRVASAQGLFGLKASISQIGSAVTFDFPLPRESHKPGKPQAEEHEGGQVRGPGPVALKPISGDRLSRRSSGSRIHLRHLEQGARKGKS
jgi:hypothetical protein